ncbi:leukemia inhibitory factor receptor [Sparus aurata]|uniref:Leukemia inhibitory factor receptor-like n=1 Tax=Sparus aurata TaxID=8175 RepID=A0A671WM47_SPAAU|nr:leukemia inhibitory factor receptor-like [Sparus aurata]
MVGGGFQFDLSDSKCSPHLLLLGLILAHLTMFSSHVRASSVTCNSTSVSLKYQHCGVHPDGVHDLDCFGSSKKQGWKTCKWKPGDGASEKTYTLIIQQQSKEFCKAHINITDVSKKIQLNEKYNMTAEVYENSESANCTKAVFRGSPKKLWRCGPPYAASFSRHSGRLAVNVSWPQGDRKYIKDYYIRYKALDSLLWSEAQSQREKCTVEHVNASLVYTVQIKCVTTSKCSQCLWSDAYTVPSELTTRPVIVGLKDTDFAGSTGRRLITLTWRFSAKELHDGYRINVRKVSGEATHEQINTTQPEITLILSYSAYHLNISAVNNASTSPGVTYIIPQREDGPGTGAGKLNVTVHSNTSLTIYWKDNLIEKYVCYSAEWIKKGHKSAYMSFFQDEDNYKTLSLSLQEPLEPYARYSITLHTRPNKDTCNMKHINNSESTYGSTQFYFIEGSPVSAPSISNHNVTLNSVLLRWTSIPEEDIQGFLQGYIIHYTEFQNWGARTERNITVDPELNSYELLDLKSGTAYEVQISGFTRAGEGVRSKESLFKTTPQDSHLGVITVFAVLAIVLFCGPPIIKRTKVILWPSIPNPRNSNAMQKIEGACELELLQSLKTLKVEEWDTNSLQIVEKEDVIPASTLTSMLPLLHPSEDEEDSEDMSGEWFQRDSEDPSDDIFPDDTIESFSDIQRTDLQTSTQVFPTGYTTMEMFQHGMPQPVSTPVTQEAESVEADLTAVKSSLDYVRQFSTSPILDSEDMSTIL